MIQISQNFENLLTTKYICSTLSYRGNGSLIFAYNVCVDVNLYKYTAVLYRYTGRLFVYIKEEIEWSTMITLQKPKL